MRLTKHITEDLGLKNSAKRHGVPRRPALSIAQDGLVTNEMHRTTAQFPTLRAFLKLLKLRCQ